MINVGGPTWNKLMKIGDINFINQLNKLSASSTGVPIKKLNIKNTGDIGKSIKKDNVTRIRQYIRFGLDPNKIIYGVSQSTYDIVKYLLSIPKLKRDDEFKGQTPLLVSINNDDIEMVKILYKGHVNMDKGFPLFVAIRNDKMFKQLLSFKYGPSLNSTITIIKLSRGRIKDNILSYIIKNISEHVIGKFIDRL